MLQALESGGPNAALAFAERVEREIRTAMLLTGSRTLAALRRAPRVLVGELSDWLRQEPSDAPA
jgi:isopentenyl diphosphate isomerase/L-lactate dehydrogenase-like FMN-dependent dehydrogenase